MIVTELVNMRNKRHMHIISLQCNPLIQHPIIYIIFYGTDVLDSFCVIELPATVNFEYVCSTITDTSRHSNVPQLTYYHYIYINQLKVPHESDNGV